MAKPKTQKEILDKIIEAYLLGLSAEKSAKEFGCCRSVCIDELKKRGIKPRPSGYKKYKCDENFFEIINTEEKAYWLGFITADGCVSEIKNSLQICLKQADKGHLIKFLKSINSDYKIHDSIRDISKKYPRIKPQELKLLSHTRVIYK